MNRMLVASLFGLAVALSPAAHASDAVGAPGVIPHPVEAYTPITPEKNACTMCHRAAKEAASKKGEIPLTHFVDGKLSGARYECLLCHVPSTGKGEPAPVDVNAAP